MTAAHTRNLKLSRELALLTLGRIESGLYQEEHRRRDHRGQLRRGGLPGLHLRGRDRRREPARARSTTARSSTTGQSREDEQAEDEDEEERRAALREGPDPRHRSPRSSELKNELVLEHWIPWDQVYGDRRADDDDGGAEEPKLRARPGSSARGPRARGRLHAGRGAGGALDHGRHHAVDDADPRAARASSRDTIHNIQETQLAGPAIMDLIERDLRALLAYDRARGGPAARQEPRDLGMDADSLDFVDHDRQPRAGAGRASAFVRSDVQRGRLPPAAQPDRRRLPRDLPARGLRRRRRALRRRHLHVPARPREALRRAGASPRTAPTPSRSTTGTHEEDGEHRPARRARDQR